jgi:hypothetical protein
MRIDVMLGVSILVGGLSLPFVTIEGNGCLSQSLVTSASARYALGAPWVLGSQPGRKRRILTGMFVTAGVCGFYPGSGTSRWS